MVGLLSSDSFFIITFEINLIQHSDAKGWWYSKDEELNHFEEFPLDLEAYPYLDFINFLLIVTYFVLEYLFGLFLHLQHLHLHLLLTLEQVTLNSIDFVIVRYLL